MFLNYFPNSELCRNVTSQRRGKRGEGVKSNCGNGSKNRKNLVTSYMDDPHK